MGTETAYPIGTILTRREPQGDGRDQLKVVGGGKEEVVVTSNTDFTENFGLQAGVIRAEYEANVDTEGVHLSTPTYVDPGPTPEQVFGTPSGGGISRTDRVLREDAQAVAERAKVDSGLKTQVVVGAEPVDPLEAARAEVDATVTKKTTKTTVTKKKA
jgi:hypothetical protein